MGKKANKASRKYAASGQLKAQIQNRRKQQQVKKKIEGRKHRKTHESGKGKGKRKADDEATSEEEEEITGKEGGKFQGMSVDDFLGAGFMQGIGDGEEASVGGDEEEEEEDVGSESGSFGSVDELEEEGQAHKIDLEKLAEQDPGFYEYLKKNDPELLEFQADNGDEDEDEDMDAEESERRKLNKSTIRQWQRAIIEHRSLKALRKLLMAFRSAAHMNDDVDNLTWTIEGGEIYQQVLTTAFRFTPVVLEHHVPCKILPDGRVKPPSQTKKYKTVQKMVLSYFYNVIHILEQLTENEMLLLAVNESVKLIPYVLSSRKAMKLYLKASLNLWSSAVDEIRIATFIAIRKLFLAADQGIKDLVLKSTYLTLVRRAKATSSHTLPSVTFMKNSASELFALDHDSAYQHAFSYIRQLAVHLRNSMKVKTKEAYKQVYNWQYAHCVDFWSLLLARACDVTAQPVQGHESPLQELIYPLTQVTLGAIKLVPNSRSHPFHLCLIRSLIHISRHTRTYIPLVPFLLPIITATLSPSSRPKSSTLKPLDLEACIRAPAQYVRTRVYATCILEESLYLLAEWLASRQVQGSIGFPEIVVPLTVSLKRSSKHASGGKEAGMAKILLERVAEGTEWIEKRRQSVPFGPKFMDEVFTWESEIPLEDSPMVKYAKTQRKQREKRQKLLQKAREGEEEIVED